MRWREKRSKSSFSKYIPESRICNWILQKALYFTKSDKKLILAIFRAKEKNAFRSIIPYWICKTPIPSKNLILGVFRAKTQKSIFNYFPPVWNKTNFFSWNHLHNVHLFPESKSKYFHKIWQLHFFPIFIRFCGLQEDGETFEEVWTFCK